MLWTNQKQLTQRQTQIHLGLTTSTAWCWESKQIWVALLACWWRTGNWTSRRAAIRHCCLPPGQMQSGSWRAGAGHQRSADWWESVRDCTASTHTTQVAIDALALEPDREKQSGRRTQGRGKPSGPWQTEPACCVEVPGASGPRTSAARRLTCCPDLRTSTSAEELRTNTEEHEQRNKRTGAEKGGKKNDEN
jgi:hypothetical protein